MEIAEEAISTAKEQSLILKGKRTKRQRPLSPIPFSIVPPMSSQEPDVEEDSTSFASKEKSLNDEINTNKNDNNVLTNGVTSPASSSSNNNATLKAAADEEDQDMANCLILLAQGHYIPQEQPPQTRQFMTSYQESGNNNNNSYRSSSRRFLETSSPNGTTSGGRAGYYVYQCKTCDRTFPSFQALGGHRASHKKPKAAAGLHSDHDLKKSIYNDAVSLHLNNVPTATPNNNSSHRSLVVYGKAGNNKVHECGICGAEFTSGQALGGHMRRHRGAVVASAAASASTAMVRVASTAATANTALSLSPMSFDQMSVHPVQAPVKRARSAVVSLDLDLNLPAPEDVNRVNGLSFASKQEQEHEHEQTQQREEQKSLVLSSAPTLVDCHY
ncbi:hypothetical protein Bca52824_094674 [Brassica carinata]|uniref:C2H2-type domain-containing protein n=1 Tax=Brassica carinata TaxID=52824 RepID=A0A8X7TIZ0_BRACI|nr:hypothetical protein Bca52824_094674 [Brassica carinata]